MQTAGGSSDKLCLQMITITGNFSFQLEEQVLKEKGEQEKQRVSEISQVPYSLPGLQPNRSVESSVVSSYSIK